jgi:LmbE family N-acetylglucosaminyl deacetylase
MKLRFLGLLAAIFFLVAGGYWFVQQRQGIYRYPVSSDYIYDFDKTGATHFDLRIDGGKLTLPPLTQDWDSAFLSVTVKPAVPLGFFLQPSIEISSGNEKLKQTFEYGASGVRYLNLSRFVVSKRHELHLEGHFLTFADTHARLALFKNRKLADAKVLIISPHPDDAEIASYGLYSHTQSYIATLTAGESGSNKYNEIYRDARDGNLKKGELRVWDSLFIPALGGVSPERTVNLGYFDNTLGKMYAAKSQPVASAATKSRDIGIFRSRNVSKLLLIPEVSSPTWDSLVNDLAILLEIIKPEVVVAPYPALDAHPDHKYAAVALFEAIKKVELTQGDLYLYSNHCIYNEFYPYGETGDPLSLPPNFGPSPYFTSLYSYPLSVETSRSKLFALEAMHDLRLDTEWRSPAGALKIFGNSLKKYLSGYDKSYFRRAVRDNELFFVLPIRDIYEEPVDKILRR